MAFVISALMLGGAEMMLWKLLSRIDRRRFSASIVTLSSRADCLLERFKASGIQCHSAGMRHATEAVTGLFRVGRALGRLHPDIVQGWMYQGNLAASFGSMFVRPRPRVLWSIRAGLTSLSEEKWHLAVPMWLGGKLSFLPEKIINNSVVSAAEHEQQLGYRADRRLILPNGFDTDVFRPSREARALVRAQLRLPEDAVLIGLVGRYHVVKNHAGFLQAAEAISAAYPQVRYLLVGDNLDAANPDLRRLISEHRLEQCVYLLGRRDDIDRLTAALDIAVSCSTTEGFPNVIGEAMSCGVPCVVTDVGDSARLVGDTGKAVPRRNAEALAQAIKQLIEIGPEKRAALGRRARAHIVEHFSLDAVVRQYEDLYARVYEESLRTAKH